MNDKNKESGRQAAPDAWSAVYRRASEWLVLLESGDATDEDRTRFEAWLREDPVHRAAYADLKETWGRLTAMRGRVRTGGNAEPDPELMLKQLGRRGTRRHLALAVAATVLAAAVLGGFVFLPGGSAITHRTDVGERRDVSLPDGSRVELNTATELLVEYTEERRRIVMSRGEAFFQVAEEENRPFTVAAGRGVSRAAGTGFAVRLKSQDLVSVTVTEGIVEVVHIPAERQSGFRKGKTEEPSVLRRGQRAEYNREASRIEEVPPDELDRTQAWRRGLLVFEDASLAEVVAEVQRYTQTRLVLADPEIGQLRIGGTFKAGRVEALLDVLEKGLGIRVSREDPDTIVLHATTDSTAHPPS